jgi:hypothetical protein
VLPSTATQDHFLEVARCPIVERCLDDPEPRHPCASIVLDQWEGIPVADRLRHWREVHQLPEPWQGHLEQARILFVSSNPSISGTITQPIQLPPPPDDERVFRGKTASEHPSVRRVGGPKWIWADDELVDRYDASFDLYIASGTKDIRPDGSVPRATMFWSAVKRRAQELIPERPVRPGLDYALTEAVRCKSRNERGAPEALNTCSGRYLHTTLEHAGASVFVVLGRWAKIAVERHLNVHTSSVVGGPVRVGERERYVAFLPHPNARAARSFAAVCSSDEIETLRRAVRHAT